MNKKIMAVSGLLLCLMVLILFGCSGNPGGEADIEIDSYSGYLYAPDGKTEPTETGLAVLLTSQPPSGYQPVPEALIYDMENPEVSTGTDANGRFEYDFVSPDKSASGRNSAMLIIEPGGAFKHFAPIRLEVSMNSSADQEITQLMLFPNAKNIYTGQIIQLYARVKPKNGPVVFCDPLKAVWQIDDTSIATVDQNGICRGVSPGKACITISYGGHTCKGMIHVKGKTPQYRIRGKIEDHNGNPVPWALVTVMGIDTAAKANENGSYSMPGLPAGEELNILVYSDGILRFAGLISVDSDSVYDIIFPQQAPEYGIVSGTVSNADGAELPGVLASMAEKSTVTGPGGEFILERIPEGSYRISFSKADYNSCSVYAEIVGGQTTRLNQVLYPNQSATGSINGRVVDSSGRGISGASVAYNAKKTPAGAGYSATDGNGYFSFANVPAGDYKVEASKENYTPNSADAKVSSDKETTIRITLNGAEPSPTPTASPSPTPMPSPTPGPSPSPTPSPDPSWMYVGNQGFSESGAINTSLFIYDGTPYVAYKDEGNESKATLMKYNGAGWVSVGNIGFSEGSVKYTSLYISNSGIPYVAYTDNAYGDKASVMKFDGSGWVYVGNPGFSPNEANWTALFIDDADTPYVLFIDKENEDKATVMKYDGSGWVYVGSPGFSPGMINGCPSIFIKDPGTPYVAFRDTVNENKASVMKYDGSDWVYVGSPHISSGHAPVWRTGLFIDNSGTPYVAFRDNANGEKASVVKYDGSDWVNVGNPGFTSDAVHFVSLYIDNSGIPFIGFRSDEFDGKASIMKFDGSDWVYVGEAGFSSGAIWHPSLFVDENGIPYIAYQDGFSEDKASVVKFDTP